jgi:hypothetical protein
MEVSASGFISPTGSRMHAGKVKTIFEVLGGEGRERVETERTN